ncbi:MAG: hypothetical protein H6823_03840 [Planctomycetaceae bacterium]|nr:hypothetical protein [Planctomycetaceae bacterium]
MAASVEQQPLAKNSLANGSGPFGDSIENFASQRSRCPTRLPDPARAIDRNEGGGRVLAASHPDQSQGHGVVLQKGGAQGIFFNDSDVVKAIEGAAHALAIHPGSEAGQIPLLHHWKVRLSLCSKLATMSY